MKGMARALPTPQTVWPLPPLRPGERSAARLSQRLVLGSLLALLVAAGVATVANFAWPWAAYEERVRPAGHLDQFPRGTVTSIGAVTGFNGRPGLHIVRLEEGELLAFLATDPLNGCAVQYRPDIVFNGRAGWFRDTCYGGTYDLTGELAFGPSPRGLDRLAISVRDGRVYVDTRAITPSASRPPPGYEFQYGAGLGPSSVPLGW